MTKISYHKNSEPELRKLIAEAERKLVDFRFAIAGSKTRNVREGRALRKEIARVKTELTSRARTSPKI